MNANILRGVCLTILCGILVSGLWPFSPFRRNDVHWLGSENGLYFGALGGHFKTGHMRRRAGREVFTPLRAGEASTFSVV